MYIKCETIKGAQRQKEFENALLSLMKCMPYKDITIVALCKEVGVQRKSFYRYFEEVDDIMCALLDEILIEAFLLIEVKPEMEKFFAFWKNQSELLDLLDKHNLSHMLLNRAYEKCFHNNEYKTMTERELRYISYTASYISLVLAWHKGGMRQSVKNVAKILKDMYGID